MEKEDLGGLKWTFKHFVPKPGYVWQQADDPTDLTNIPFAEFEEEYRPFFYSEEFK